MMTINKKATLIHKVFIDSFRYAYKLGLVEHWQSCWNKYNTGDTGAVKTVIHGFDVIINSGNTYPLNTRMIKSYNNPLIELVHQAFKIKKRKINYLDIGAATGDTILFVVRNCEGLIENIDAIDGDEEFVGYLKYNTRNIDNIKVVSTLLSSDDEDIKSLVKIHQGTASAQGDQTVKATTLDSLLNQNVIHVPDIIKIDVDGYDGKVLSGAKRILAETNPLVIFEWHPILCKKTGNDWKKPFYILEGCGYHSYLWYTKYGEFSHVTNDVDEKMLDQMAEIAIRNKASQDWHFDVVAVHKSMRISIEELAEMEYARAKKSRF